MNAQSPEVQPDTSPNSSAVKGLRLPEPDRDNITVLLHNLPKDPVLPWNHYDSPWKSEDDRPLEEEATSEDSSDLTVPSDEVDSSAEPIVLQDDTAIGQESPLETEVSPPLENTLDQQLEQELEEDRVSDSSQDLEVLDPNRLDGEERPVEKVFEPGFVNLTPDFIPEESYLAEATEDFTKNLDTTEVITEATPEATQKSAKKDTAEDIDQDKPDTDTTIVSPSDPDPQLLSQLG